MIVLLFFDIVTLDSQFDEVIWCIDYVGYRLGNDVVGLYLEYVHISFGESTFLLILASDDSF